VPLVPRLLVTGSVFEPGAGQGGALPAFSPYGLSKAFTSETFRYLCDRHGVSFGRFVIANPFGPMEEPRFTSSLVRAWRAGETPQVRTDGCAPTGRMSACRCCRCSPWTSPTRLASRTLRSMPTTASWPPPHATPREAGPSSIRGSRRSLRPRLT